MISKLNSDTSLITQIRKLLLRITDVITHRIRARSFSEHNKVYLEKICTANKKPIVFLLFHCCFEQFTMTMASSLVPFLLTICVSIFSRRKKNSHQKFTVAKKCVLCLLGLLIMSIVYCASPFSGAQSELQKAS